MKAVSASIIVLAGSVLLGIGCMPGGTDQQTFAACIGALLGLIGFVTWIVAMTVRDLPLEKPTARRASLAEVLDPDRFN